MEVYKKNRCGLRTLLEKILIVVVVLLVCLLIALFVVFVLHLQNAKQEGFIRVKKVSSASSEPNGTTSTIASIRTPRNEPNICMSQQCVKAASQIIDFLDTSVDPCDNFYNFVCGSFLNRSKETKEITPLSKIEAVTLNQLDSLIIEPLTEPLPKSWELQRKYYKTCMNTAEIDNNNGTTLLNLIKNLGDWPVLLGRFWKENKFHWLRSMIQCRENGFGYEYFMSLSVIDASNGSRPLLLSISPPAVNSLPYQFKEYYIDVMANIAIDLGAPVYLAKNEFSRVYEFEEQLKLLAEDQIKNGQDIILNVTMLQRNFPQIPWKELLNQIARSPARFDESTSVYLRADRYLLNLQNLLERTAVSTQANYVAWKIIENFHSYLNERIRNRYDSFLISLNPNNNVINNRHLFCLDTAKLYFPSVAELAYVRKYLTPQERVDVKKMAGNVGDQLIRKIKNSDWLDEKTKNFSIGKLSQVESHVGTSDEAYNGDFDEVLDMEGFDLDTDDIVEMVTKLSMKQADNYFKKVNQDPKQITKETLQKSPMLGIKTFYAPEFNTLVMPAPFLQGVMYNIQRPQYMNYGVVGSVIGHKFTRGLVAEKSQRRDGIQWSPESSDNFEEKIRCLVQDYEAYTGNSGSTKDAKYALEENIGDLIGPEISYRAYQQWVRSHGQEKTLPSLNYTQNQIFWIMSGAFRCYYPNLKPNLRFGDYLPFFSVTLGMRNSEAFASDFNCPSGSNMNPQTKCTIL